MVEAAMTKDANAKTGGAAMWRYRSPVWSACQALIRMAMVPSI